MEKLEAKIDSLTKAFNDLNVRLAGQCARHEERLCRAEADINRSFEKIRGVWGWVVGGIGFLGSILTLFYFLLSAGKIDQ